MASASEPDQPASTSASVKTTSVDRCRLCGFEVARPDRSLVAHRWHIELKHLDKLDRRVACSIKGCESLLCNPENLKAHIRRIHFYKVDEYTAALDRVDQLKNALAEKEMKMILECFDFTDSEIANECLASSTAMSGKTLQRGKKKVFMGRIDELKGESNDSGAKVRMSKVATISRAVKKLPPPSNKVTAEELAEPEPNPSGDLGAKKHSVTTNFLARTKLKVISSRERKRPIIFSAALMKPSAPSPVVITIDSDRDVKQEERGPNNENTLKGVGKAAVESTGAERDFLPDLVVLGLPPQAEALGLHRYFSHYGRVAFASVQRDEWGESRGFGFVRMATAEEQQLVKSQPGGHFIRGKMCTVDVLASETINN